MGSQRRSEWHEGLLERDRVLSTDLRASGRNLPGLQPVASNGQRRHAGISRNVRDEPRRLNEHRCT
jgi:hypothetical protein